MQILDTVLEHELSIADLDTKGSHQRYANFLRAERSYYRNYGSAVQKVFAQLRMLKEFLYLLLHTKDKTYARMCLRAAMQFSDTRITDPVNAPSTAISGP